MSNSRKKIGSIITIIINRKKEIGLIGAIITICTFSYGIIEDLRGCPTITK